MCVCGCMRGCVCVWLCVCVCGWVVVFTNIYSSLRLAPQCCNIRLVLYLLDIQRVAACQWPFNAALLLLVIGALWAGFTTYWGWGLLSWSCPHSHFSCFRKGTATPSGNSCTQLASPPGTLHSSQTSPIIQHLHQHTLSAGNLVLLFLWGRRLTDELQDRSTGCLLLPRWNTSTSDRSACFLCLSCIPNSTNRILGCKTRSHLSWGEGCICGLMVHRYHHNHDHSHNWTITLKKNLNHCKWSMEHGWWWVPH